MRCYLFTALMLAVGGPAWGQQAVQQPVVSSTSVGTTVSVPDRGSALLGGVSSAQSARSQYGPLPSGTNRGFSRQATSITTNVYIHDLQAMDEAILNSGSTDSETHREKTSSLAAVSSKRDAVVNTPVASSAEKVVKFEQLAK